jgi:hypothetical protein
MTTQPVEMDGGARNEIDQKRHAQNITVKEDGPTTTITHDINM